jgi:hypothetical protein
VNKKISGTYMKRNGEAGQALAIAVIGLTVLMLAAGLSIDMGYLRYQRRRMQTAADSAAIAAATQLGGAYSDAAIADATLNGFNPSNNVTITTTPVTCPDTSSNCVQVQVSQPQTTFFMKILGTNLTPTVSTVATAEQVPGLGCIYALSNAPDAIQIGYYIDPTYNGFHAIIAGTTCGLVDNGGLDIGPNISHTVYASSVGDGSYNEGGTVTPNPITLSTSAGDPFASLGQPSSPGSCGGGGPVPYSAGTFTYPCGLSLDTDVTPTINLSPGLYNIGGGGLTISGTAGTVTGDGVSFYVSGSGSVQINAGLTDGTTGFGVTVHLQAPADASAGGIPGVVLYQDRADTQTASVELAGFQWAGSPTDPAYPGSYLWGAVYVPSATLMVGGIGNDNANPSLDKCASVPRLTTVVAYQLVLEYNLNFSSDDCVWPPVSVSTPVPSPNRNAVLVK